MISLISLLETFSKVLSYLLWYAKIFIDNICPDITNVGKLFNCDLTITRHS